MTSGVGVTSSMAGSVCNYSVGTNSLILGFDGISFMLSEWGYRLNGCGLGGCEEECNRIGRWLGDPYDDRLDP